MKAIILHSIDRSVFEYNRMVKDYVEFLDIRSDQVGIINNCEISLQSLDLPRFFWSPCTPQTRLVVLKWIPEDFNFQRMYNAVSNGIDVERRLAMDFHIEPRFIFMTDYNPQLVGASATNRFLKINCSPNYQY